MGTSGLVGGHEQNDITQGQEKKLFMMGVMMETLLVLRMKQDVI